MGGGDERGGRAEVVGHVLRGLAAAAAVLVGFALRERPLGGTIAFFGVAFLAMWLLFFIMPDVVPLLFGDGRPRDEDETPEGEPPGEDADGPPEGASGE